MTRLIEHIIFFLESLCAFTHVCSFFRYFGECAKLLGYVSAMLISSDFPKMRNANGKSGAGLRFTHDSDGATASFDDVLGL